jgi:hypothetical protein
MRSEVAQLLDLLRVKTTGLSSREDIHSALFENEVYNDKRIRYLLTDANRVLFAYFSYKQLTKQPEEQQVLLLKELSDRACYGSFDKIYNREMKQLGSKKPIDVESLSHRYKLQSLKAQQELELGQRASDVFEDSSKSLDNYFVAKKLQISAEKINLNFILKKEWNDPFLRNILEQIDAGMFSTSPYIALYRLVIKSLTDQENETVFNQLKQQIALYVDRLSEAELSDLYQYLLNYCIRRINAGRLGFQDELLDVYKDALHYGALLSDGRISQWDFKNVVTIALRTKQIDYAREFIHSYKPLLPTDQRTNALAYNLANLHFAEGDYHAAIKQLQKVDLDDVFYRLDARSILLKSYYELDDQDALFYHATAFRSMLNRNRKISDHQRTIYLNLIKHTVYLAKYGHYPDKLAKLATRTQENSNVADLRWLEEKIADLKA